MCRIPQTFDGFEKKYEKNMLDEKILSLEHGKLYGYLIQLFKEKKDCIDCFIHSEYTYRGRDWNSGKTWNVALWEQLEYNRKMKLDQKKNKCWEVLIKYSIFNFSISLYLTQKKCSYCLIILYRIYF